MQLTSDIIYGFTGSLLSTGFDEPAPTPYCHREWWELCCSPYKRVAIAAPRGHAKSTAITKSYTLASVLFRDRQYVVIISDTYKQAVQFLGEIKRELSFNDQLRGLFKVGELLTDREDEIVVQMEDGHQFKIIALGSEQKIRGLLWNGKRPDLVVGDDMENDELVMNPDRREKFRNWVNNAVLPAMSERGIVRIVGTILHMDAFLERLMPRDRDPNTEHSFLSSRTKKPVGGWMGIRYAAHGPEARFDNILWPVKWTEERLKELQAVFVGQGNPEGYYQEYLNRPIDTARSFFRKDDFMPMEERDYELPFMHYPTYLSVDLAVTTKEKRDWCVFGIGSTDESGMLHMRHVLRERMDSKEQVDTILQLKKRYGFNTMLIGKGTLEKSIGPFLKEAIRKEGLFIHIEAIPEVIDKRQRAQSIRGRMRSGGVKFDKKKAWFPELEQEMLEFDRGTHDDQVDMMSLFGMFLSGIQEAPSRKEIDDELWDNEHRSHLEQLLDQGRSQYTGY